MGISSSSACGIARRWRISITRCSQWFGCRLFQARFDRVGCLIESRQFRTQWWVPTCHKGLRELGPFGPVSLRTSLMVPVESESVPDGPYALACTARPVQKNTTAASSSYQPFDSRPLELGVRGQLRPHAGHERDAIDTRAFSVWAPWDSCAAPEGALHIFEPELAQAGSP